MGICVSIIAPVEKAVVSGLEFGELALEEVSRHPTNECIAADNVKREGSHVLVEGSLVSTTYERGNGKSKKAKSSKQMF